MPVTRGRETKGIATIMDDRIVAAYRKARRPMFNTFEAHRATIHITPASMALRNVREDAQIANLERASFLRILDAGHDRFDVRMSDRDGECMVRVMVEADDDYAIDFDCCTASGTSRRYGYASGDGQWKKCACVGGRDYPEDVTTPEANARRCTYGQPCRHKCEEARRVGHEGAYGICAEYRDPTTGEWEHAESVWGFVGDDWRTELPWMVEAAREALRDAYHAIATHAREARTLAAFSASLVNTASI